MATRIEIELTSARGDGTWTWRAAGARAPKGVVDASLLPAGSVVGDVLRAEADIDLDGITVLSVLPPKGKRREPERIEILGTPRDFTPVTSSLLPKSERPEGRPRRDRDDGERRSRPDGARRARPEKRPDGDRSGPRRDRAAGAPPGERPQRDGPQRDGPQRGRPQRGLPERERPAPRDRTSAERPRPDRRQTRAADAPAAADDSRPRPKRLSPGRVHRDAVLAALPVEQRPVAEHVLRGGVPAVRAAIEEQNAKLRAAGEPEVKADALVTMAEDLLPRLRSAEWRDRADAAVAAVDEIGLRDLRAVVTGGEAAARDEASRALAATLREALERRTEELRQRWLDEVVSALKDGRVVRAIRISSRPPEPGARFPAELATQLSEATGAAMAADTPAERWVAVLDAVLSSPIRRTVQPAGLPPDPPPELLHAARMAASRVPALVGLLGLERAPIPPPPGRVGARPPAARRPPQPAAE
jgi:hypothetical protein